MSFGELMTGERRERESRTKQNFFVDMGLMILCLLVLEMQRDAYPQGCGIPLREWLMVFSVLYFTRSIFPLAKVYVSRYLPEYRLTYDVGAFAVANGLMICWMVYGFDIYFSDSNDCDNVSSTSFFSAIMFVILFIGYFICFVYLMIACTVPCLYCMIREQAEQNRLQAGGVREAQVPMVLASLSKTNYNAETFQHETHCIICLVDYEESDMVTKLRCDPRHYFHTHCLESWVKSGNNICPYCRSPILNFQQHNHEEESRDSS